MTKRTKQKRKIRRPDEAPPAPAPTMEAAAPAPRPVAASAPSGGLFDWTPRANAAAAAGCAIVVADLVGTRAGIFGFRSTLAVVGILAMVAFADPHVAFAPLRSPAGGWLRWVKLGALICLAILVLTVVAFFAFQAAGRPLALDGIDAAKFGKEWFKLVVVAPLLEETIYRLVLCLALLPLLGARGTVLASGVAFAVLHVLGRNPAPNNLVAGFFFAWAFVRSGSFAIPVLLHVVGNLLVCLFQLGIGGTGPALLR